MICYVVKWMKTISLTVSSLVSKPLCLLVLFCFYLQFCILSCIHFKIIRCTVKSLIATSTYCWTTTEKRIWALKPDMPTLRKLKEGDSLSSVSSWRPTMVGPEGQRKFWYLKSLEARKTHRKWLFYSWERKIFNSFFFSKK